MVGRRRLGIITASLVVFAALFVLAEGAVGRAYMSLVETPRKRDERRREDPDMELTRIFSHPERETCLGQLVAGPRATPTLLGTAWRARPVLGIVDRLAVCQMSVEERTTFIGYWIDAHARRCRYDSSIRALALIMDGNLEDCQENPQVFRLLENQITADRDRTAAPTADSAGDSR